jgi:hypothetical protein
MISDMKVFVNFLLMISYYKQVKICILSMGMYKDSLSSTLSEFVYVMLMASLYLF